ncbi:hypothetical protein D6789_03400 [Candidatus Woesearchaeota archaeon]|nr:MAG: hypothetical protein D6789_03400 [Candidatus Woesearchaeota archaeon]
MAQRAWWKELLKSFSSTTGLLVGSVKEAAIETMDEAQRRIHETVRHVIKALIVFLVIAFGVVFALVGLARFIDARWHFLAGTGAMLIGGACILLGLFAWAVRR